jgi:Protein of unknown function (DUF1579)
MSDVSTSDMSEMQPTSALPQHQWLQKLVGTWSVEGEYMMGPDAPIGTSTGTETNSMFGDLWVLGEGDSTMSDGSSMSTKNGIGFDVSFKEYRSFWVVTASSHLWKGTGTLSEDGKTMTLICEGPDMVVDGKTALYKDVIELIDADHRTLTSYSEDGSGGWTWFMKTRYTRI